MKILMVTPYPPIRDGIAAYAVQAVAALRAEGHDVEVLSPGPSAAHHHLDLEGPRGGLALAKRVRRYDKVIVQFHPDVFYPPPHRHKDRALANLALMTAFTLAKRVEVRLHEVDYRMGRRPGPGSIIMRAMWRSVDLIEVHTEAERESFRRAFGVPDDKVTVADHGGHFKKKTSAGRDAARESLGIPLEPFMFLCIGFIQPHKGFDRAVRAFADASIPAARLDIVGSVRVEEQEYVEYLADLQGLVEHTPGAHLHDRYVSDEEFDRWIVASDAVVLPYRHIWSSGVLERAELYERPVIATRVGALEQQAHPGTMLVSSDSEIVAAMRTLAGGAPVASADQGWSLGSIDRESVMKQVRERAAGARGRILQTHDAAGRGAPARRRKADALRRIGPLELPEPTSSRPSARLAKRIVRKLTGWEIDPIVRQVNRLHSATIRSLEDD